MKNSYQRLSRYRGDKVDLKKWSSKVKPVYNSKKQYKNLLEIHVEQLSAQQQLLYADNRHAILLIFQGWMRRERCAIRT